MSQKENSNIPFVLSLLGYVISSMVAVFFVVSFEIEWYFAPLLVSLSIYVVYMLLLRKMMKNMYPVFFGYKTSD